MSADLRLRNPLVICANRQCRLQHRIAERQTVSGELYSLCPRCRDDAFVEQPEPPPPIARVDCGKCPRITTGCIVGHCLKAL